MRPIYVPEEVQDGLLCRRADLRRGKAAPGARGVRLRDAVAGDRGLLQLIASVRERGGPVPGPGFCLILCIVVWYTTPMTDQELRRVDACARATIIGAPITIWEPNSTNTVLWPWRAEPIPEIYKVDPRYAVALAKDTGLTSYLPRLEQAKLWAKALPQRIYFRLFRLWWFGA